MADREQLVIRSGDELLQATTRRKFLGAMGAFGSVLFLPSVFTACNSDNGITGIGGSPASFALNLSTDTGILNYAYALEQLEAAYYTTALTSPGFNALSADEKEVLTDLQKHEVIHREFFRQQLGLAAIPDISFNLTTVASLQASRSVLLSTSQLLEDTGVSAYNGAGKYLQNAANLLIAGKIVSVEARHAAAIRDIRDTTGKLFAGDDVVNAAGLDVKAEPKTVLAAVVQLNVVDTNASPLNISTQPDADGRVAATGDQTAPTPT